MADLTRRRLNSVRSFLHSATGHPIQTFISATGCIIALWLLWPVPPPFPDVYSHVVYDIRGTLMRVTCAADGQVRFPLSRGPLPRKYVTTVTACEDRRYFLHPGVDPFALAKSALVNIVHGRRIRGGSTIAMQVARLSRPKKRTYAAKILECATAMRLSLHIGKNAMLRLYAAHVPMGGNTVGVESASWRYFGKPLNEITWSEAALFAVLPNAPSSLNLEKQRPLLKAKRDRALRLLLSRGIIDTITCRLSCDEPLPPGRGVLPFEAPHFCDRVIAQAPGLAITTTLDLSIQRRVEEIVEMYHRQLAIHGVRNLAVLVARTDSATIAAYAGSQGYSDTVNSGRVDGIEADRSTGSLLKPFLVAKTLDRGPYTMDSRLQDVPTFFGSFFPQNASREFSGLCTMDEMLIKSLNVPAVRLLNWYGVDDYYTDLKNAGVSGLFRSSDGYGLSLVLGGAESNLWDLTRLFCTLGNLGCMRRFRVLTDDAAAVRDTTRFCSEGAAWLVINTLSKLNRPDAEYYWRLFTNQVPVAWKTGTSYGQKDAWAIGVNAQWTIGVWAGNFSGQGNASLGGAQSAGPILFSLFNALSDKSRNLWFTKPEYDLCPVTVCRISGLPVSPWCTDTMLSWKPCGVYQSATCPYHRRFLISKSKGFAVCSRCWSGIDTAWIVRTVYPPSVRSILALHGVPADSAPRHNPACPAVHAEGGIDIIYPVEDVTIMVPRNLQGIHEKIVFKAECRHPSGRLFWYLDNAFLAETAQQHTIAVDLKAGTHRLAVQDEEGSLAEVGFNAIRK
jgi:penicillin-binding protein 1C